MLKCWRLHFHGCCFFLISSSVGSAIEKGRLSQPRFQQASIWCCLKIQRVEIWKSGLSKKGQLKFRTKSWSMECFFLETKNLRLYKSYRRLVFAVFFFKQKRPPRGRWRRWTDPWVVSRSLWGFTGHSALWDRESQEPHGRCLFVRRFVGRTVGRFLGVFSRNKPTRKSKNGMAFFKVI